MIIEKIKVDLRDAINSSSTKHKIEFFEHVEKTFDFDAYKRLIEKYDSSKTLWKKYFTFADWLVKRYQLVEELNLHNSKPMKILDIGCGPSHFGYICSFFGHEVIGMDIPGIDIFKDLTDFFGQKRIEYKIEPFTPLPSIGKFDLITAISAAFFHKSDGTLFTKEEWIYFLDDLDNHLNPNGQIFLKLNPKKRYDGLKYWDDEFINMIKSRRGYIKGKFIRLGNFT